MPTAGRRLRVSLERHPGELGGGGGQAEPRGAVGGGRAAVMALRGCEAPAPALLDARGPGCSGRSSFPRAEGIATPEPGCAAAAGSRTQPFNRMMHSVQSDCCDTKSWRKCDERVWSRDVCVGDGVAMSARRKGRGHRTRGAGRRRKRPDVVAAPDTVEEPRSADTRSSPDGSQVIHDDLTGLGCVICGSDERLRRFHLTHRIAVALCATHRDPRYLARDGGRAFTTRLERIWRANGVATSARRAALRTHRRRFGARPDRSQCPGSYSWPELRVEAERRFARHEDPAEVILDLRVRHQNDHARAPSVQTMRRWFREARWLDGDRPIPGRRGTSIEWRPRNRMLAALLGPRPRRTWYTPSGKPPHPLRHIVPRGMTLSVLPPFDAMFFDMSRREPADDDFGTRWKHGSS